MNTRIVLAALVVGLVPGSAPAAPSDVVISEVFYLASDNDDDWIELRNTGPDSIDVTNWLLCARFEYQPLWLTTLLVGNDLVLAPNEVITVQPNPPLRLHDVSDLGLYITSPFTVPSNMIDFVQWGADSIPGGGRSSVARDKGIWTELSVDHYDFVPTANLGESMSYLGTNSGGGQLTLSTDFVNGPLTPGTPVEETTWTRIKSLYRTE